ncbi:NADH:ubiquinone oxidoreductase subunit (chain C) [Streptomyces zhaozhouensis]|uniref:NADH:ubiquinone oxidoreductase subunit (Chain C) n=1 Tax=Streptomyces zhaozhouensis TaxID=1300267 RepID=A0A286E1C4_9ACTN|nr:NADH-quinone oxidoreductase subunit C [Streptomyces zhaozhouensis]SOD64690.1 NADH:ubiquinone oxidoreductase subunit (chain C) [Streptomyces zhaozhouensis]
MTDGWLPRAAAEVFGEGAVAEEAYGVLTVDVPAGDAWPAALETARAELGCDFFDWLSAVDEPGVGLRVCAHVVALGTPPRRLLLRTTVPHEAPSLPTATGVFAGAAWHERETHEMFGVDFPGHPGLEPLLLPDGFEGHPLRKDFVLAARVAKQWPGAKEPGGETPRRRQPLPPGVPDPNEWGPLKGRAPAPPAGARAAGAAGAAEGRPARPRRARAAGEGSASQRAAAGEGRPARPRRSRSASEGSASQRAAPREAPTGGNVPPDDAPDGSATVDAPTVDGPTVDGQTAAEGNAADGQTAAEGNAAEGNGEG